jgi:hypothetical protein
MRARSVGHENRLRKTLMSSVLHGMRLQTKH